GRAPEGATNRAWWLRVVGAELRPSFRTRSSLPQRDEQITVVRASNYVRVQPYEPSPTCSEGYKPRRSDRWHPNVVLRLLLATPPGSRGDLSRQQLRPHPWHPGAHGCERP